MECKSRHVDAPCYLYLAPRAAKHGPGSICRTTTRMTAAIARRHHCTRSSILGAVHDVDFARVAWAAQRPGKCRPEQQDEDDHGYDCTSTTIILSGPSASRRRTSWWAIRINGRHDDLLHHHRCGRGLHHRGRDALSRLRRDILILGCHELFFSGPRNVFWSRDHATCSFRSFSIPLLTV